MPTVSKVFTGATTAIGNLFSDKNHKLYTVYCAGGNINVATSTNGGATWSSEVAVSTVTSQHMRIAVNTSGHAHVTYINTSDDDIYYTTNASGSWSAPVGAATGITARALGMDIDSNGYLILAYVSGASGNNGFYSRKFTGAWGGQVTIKASGIANLVSVDVAITAGDTYTAVYKEYENGSFYYSSDAASWTEDDPSFESATNTNPNRHVSLCASSTNTIIMCYNAGNAADTRFSRYNFWTQAAGWDSSQIVDNTSYPINHGQISSCMGAPVQLTYFDSATGNIDRKNLYAYDEVITPSNPGTTIYNQPSGTTLGIHSVSNMHPSYGGYTPSGFGVVIGDSSAGITFVGDWPVGDQYAGTDLYGPLREAEVVIDNGTGTITHKESTSARFMDWEFTFQENHPRRVRFALSNADNTATANYLNSSCSEWSAGTAAVQLGDEVTFRLYRPYDTTNKDDMLVGKITSIDQTSDGVLNIEAKDYSDALNHIKSNAIIYNNYADQDASNDSWDPAGVVQLSVRNNDILFPLADIKLAHTDVRSAYGSGTSTTVAFDNGYKFAQAFVAEGDIIVGAVYNFVTTDNLDTASADVNIYEDDGNGFSSRPYGNPIGTTTLSIAGSAGYHEHADFTGGNPIRLEKGKRYWIELDITSTVQNGGTFDITIVRNDANASYAVRQYLIDTGGGYAEVDNYVLEMDIDFMNYEHVEDTSAYYDSVNDYIYLFETINYFSVVDSYYTAYARGLVSYYYDTNTLQTICQDLIKLGTGLENEVDGNLDRTLYTYSCRGKSLGDCLRELMDVYETSGTWTGAQHAMAHYDNSGTPTMKVGRRINSTDPASAIYSHVADGRSDQETWVRSVDIKKTNLLRPAAVTVYGSGMNGEAICATRSDRAMTTSLYDKMSGLSENVVINDGTIRTWEDANALAYATLDGYQRDSWEGQIQLSGHHPLWDYDTTSTTYGSGKEIIHYWLPNGISNTRFHVTALRMDRTSTEITVNNKDVFVDNRLTNSYGRTEKSESFLAPIGETETIYVSVYSTTAYDGDDVYMELQDGSNVAIPNQRRVLCSSTGTPRTKFSGDEFSGSTDYNLNTYVGIFEGWNGYSSGNTGTPTPRNVKKVALYSASTGGSLVASLDLDAAVGGISTDLSFDKRKGVRAVVEFNCPIS